MTNTVFLDTVNELARAAMTGTALPSVTAKLLEHLKIIAKFFAGDAQLEVDADSATCVIKSKLAPADAPALIDTAAVLSGSGTTAAYTFAWAAADSVALRVLLDAAADPTQPQELRCEIEYALNGATERIAFPIFFETAYTRPEDPAPVATTDTSWDWLKSRLAAGDNIDLTVNNDAKVITIAAESAGGSGAWGGITGTLAAQTDLQAALDAKATTSALTVHTGNTSNPHAVTKTQVGLSAVTNDAQLKAADLDTDATMAANSDSKVASQKAVKTALALKAPLASPTLTGTPAAPTAAGGTNSTQLATTAFVKAAVDSLVAGAPGALDTLKEISDQLATDESAVSALTTTVAGKVPATRTVNGHALTADVTVSKSDLGLGNCDNTSDVSKPVSTAQQAADDNLQAQIDALGSAAIEPGVVFVSQSIGNNSTAAVGRRDLPYSAAQPAFVAWRLLNMAGRLHVLDGNVGSITVAEDMNYPLLLTGNGTGCIISAINSYGLAGASPSGDADGGAGDAARTLDLLSDGTVYIAEINGSGQTGGNGGDGGEDENARNGGDGGACASVRLRGLFDLGSVDLRCGAGGTGNVHGGTGGSGGSVPKIIIEGLVRCQSLTLAPGTAGSGSIAGTAGAAAGAAADCFIRGLRGQGSITITNAAVTAQISDVIAAAFDGGSATPVAWFVHGAYPSW